MIPNGQAAIEWRDVSKAFRGRGRWLARGDSVQALDGVHFSVPPGRVTGLVGPNGAGKTTALELALGITVPTSGEVRLEGQDPRTPAARARVGYLPELFQPTSHLTSLAFLRRWGRLSGLPRGELDARVFEVVEAVGLSADATRRIAGFSKGMRQRLGLAQALLPRPSVLILDEPMSGLDPGGRRLLIDRIAAERARGCAVVLSTHLLADVERVCDHVVILDRGRVRASGSLAEVAAGRSLEAVFLEVTARA
ncbi:MAG: ABC transporter ATP-binding protein [Nannocystaceae bacterium]